MNALSASFFSKNDIETLLIKLNDKQYLDIVERNNLILDLIKFKQPISIYELAKISGISYPTIKQVCRWLEASNFIYTVIEQGENGMPVKKISTHKSGGENDRNT